MTVRHLSARRTTHLHNLLRTHRLALAAASLSLLAVAGCGSSSDDPSTVAAAPSDQATTAPETTAAPEATTAPPAAGKTAPCKATAPTTDLSKKPVVTPPTTPAPTKTTTVDLVCGSGPEAKAGSAVKVKYVGVLYKGGKEFDSSWKTSASNTLPYQVGAGQLIPGFDQGSVGMKVGGRREILIPSADGYGPGGQGDIPPNADLIFVIDLVSAS